MVTKPYTVMYIVRHGQSQANADDYYGLDSSLTEKGRGQVEKLAQNLKNLKVDVVYASTLNRARESAAILAKSRNLTPIAIEELKERYYGILEGRKGSEVHTELAHLFTKRTGLSYAERLQFKFSDDYESDAEVTTRYIASLQQLAKTNLDKTILVVSHMTAMKCLLFYLGHGTHHEYEGQSIDNSGYIKVFSDGENFSLEEIVGRK